MLDFIQSVCDMLNVGIILEFEISTLKKEHPLGTSSNNLVNHTTKTEGKITKFVHCASALSFLTTTSLMLVL